MKNILLSRHLAVLFLLLCAQLSLSGQDNPCKAIVPGGGEITGTFYFNYGSGTNVRNLKYKQSFAIGMPLVGPHSSAVYFGSMGFWSRFVAAPGAPTVVATQGDLLDRIQVSWNLDPLSPAPEAGFKIYRDGIYLAQVEKNVRNYNDFNVIAGRPYNYEIRGVNQYGDGAIGTALGFQVPNGVVTGWVRTINDQPVPDALVGLTPLQGFSMKVDAGQGAGADPAGLTNGSFLPTHPDSSWSLCFWVKTQSVTPNAGLLSLTTTPIAFNIRAEAGGQPGISVDNGGVAVFSKTFDTPGKDGWQHVAITFEEGRYRLFVNGVLVGLASGGALPATTELLIGTLTGSDGWQGKLDELRIYHNVVLDELSLAMVMEGTASSFTPGLKFYWKMDEELGDKSFDVIKRRRLYFCNAKFDKDRPPVRTSGMTNEDGYYRIESANYGTGTTFLAKPSKDFYKHRALKFERSEADYATLPNFPVQPKATLELWVNGSGPDGDQVLISKRWGGSNDFRLLLRESGVQNHIIFYLNGSEANFGDLGNGFGHLAFTIQNNGGSTAVTAYKNGSPIGTFNLPPTSGNWSDPAQPWVLGARPSGVAYTDHYDGLIDEVALYDTTLAQTSILAHATDSRDPQERGLSIYFALDEGSGSRLNNMGAFLAGAGTVVGAAWSNFAANQETTPHVFAPNTRQVTLNPSITSVDQVDFTDRSTVAVSGFVRYAGTDCFAKDVEILVDGESFRPAIFTDSLGRFTVDFEPGFSGFISPKFRDHVFSPATWEINNLSTPIAGVLFNNIEIRKIKGRLAGGNCKRSIIDRPTGVDATSKVRVRTINGCLDMVVAVDLDGKYEFPPLPPIEMTVSVFEHSDPTIATAFDILGGQQVDLTDRDTVVDFTYFAPPQVDVSGLDGFIPMGCTEIVLEQFQNVTVNIRLKENYYDGTCQVDTAAIRINNDLADRSFDTTMSKGVLIYKFKVGTSNPSPPFLKILQVVATTLENTQSQQTVQALITGLRAKQPTFTTKLADMPTMILRDPPGDASQAYIEKGESFCSTLTLTMDEDKTKIGNVAIDVGPDLEFLVFATVLSVEVVAQIDLAFTNTMQKVSENSIEVCRTATERIATSDSDFAVGDQGGDVYLGMGMNVAVGLADQVEFDPMTCQASVKVVVSVSPDSFATGYMFSEAYLKDNVMRYLDLIINDIKTDPIKPDADTLSYWQSKQNWLAAIAQNIELKKKAPYTRNISFDAGAQYEYSVTIDSTVSQTTGSATITGKSISNAFGAYVNGVGAEGGVSIENSSGKSRSSGTGNAYSITTGFTLADDDGGDGFTLDVGTDPVFKTPVFKLKYGQSSCPWEPGTAHREAVNLQFRDGSGPSVVNVPSNEAAVYKFTLGNLSETNEDMTYAFVARPETNPDGAVIKLNGAVLDKEILFDIPFGESIPITVTVERGPVAYQYNDLEIALRSACEGNSDDPLLYKPVRISASFIQPCSEVDISSPKDGWVVYPGSLSTPGPVLRINIVGYDKSQADFDRIRVQYRLVDGDGEWINIVPPSPLVNPNQAGAEIIKANLEDIFTEFYWNTAGLSDGAYEIRAVALCQGGAGQFPGFSHIIPGRIDRQAPSIVGVPEPSDGVYNVGDEISFTFNKPINCNKLIEADIFNDNNVGLYDATTGKLIDIDISCYENKIVLVPKFQNEFFENKVIRAELHEIEDKTGNQLFKTDWEFVVDRNELAWLTDSMGLTKFEGEYKVGTAAIHNRGGYPVPFTITGAPSWVRVVPSAGTLVANQILPIRFEVDSNLAFGRWSDTIRLHTETGQNPFFMGGNEDLPIGVRVVCRPPDWKVNPNLYENTMNMVLQLDIQGTVSTDIEDIVAAYIGDQMRGSAYLEYSPEVNKYLAYLTVYGNPDDQLDPVRFEIWDASECLRYGSVVEAFTFQPDNVIGFIGSPIVLHTNSLVLREVPFGFGWNWLSFNLAFPDPSLNAALASLKRPETDLMKSQTAFSTYSGGWFGSLNTLNNTTMYIYRADIPDTLRMLGNLINPATTNIPLVTGWNWIGYVPNYSLPVDAALSSLPSQPGDLIKGQVSFAQYFNSTFGWVGNLKYMQPPNGYQIKVATPGTLTYPPPSSNKPSDPLESRGGDEKPPVAFWNVNPAQYEHSMTLIGMLKANGQNVTTATMELGVFAGTEVRGSAQAIYIAPLDAYQFFLTTYANAGGEQLKFKLFDSASGAVQDLTETMWFSPDLHQGSIESPVPFTLKTSGLAEIAAEQSFDVQPNPFSTETMFRFALPRSQEVTINVADVSGREVSSLRSLARAGLNTVTWDGTSDAGLRLGAGVYFVRLSTEEGMVTRKVVVQR